MGHAILLVALMLLLEANQGGAAVRGISSADLLQSSAAGVAIGVAMRPSVHRLRGGELGSQTQLLMSPHRVRGADFGVHEPLSPLFSSEMRASDLRAQRAHNGVHFESSLKDHSAAQSQSPLLMKQREQHKLKEFLSPTNLRTTDPGTHDLDLTTPVMAPSADAAINRAFASLANAAGTPMKNTPAKGWPARFRSELELLKSAMETYSTSQQEAMQALAQEKQRAATLEEQKAELERTMQAKLQEMEKIKSTMEERAAATEERLKLLREQVASQQVQDTDVSQQLENLEAAKTALQARATRAAEDADTLRQELTDSRAKCTTLAHANTMLEERVKEVIPLQQQLACAEAAKQSSLAELSRMASQEKRLLQEAQRAAKEVKELQGSLESHSVARARLEKDVQVLKKEKSSVIEQLRAADRSGREAREEGKQLVLEWQQQHAQLDAQLKTKASRVADIERACKTLRQDLSAAQAREKEGASHLLKMTEMKDRLAAQVEQLRAVDARRQQETGEVEQALSSLQARLRQSEAEMTALRGDLGAAQLDKDQIQAKMSQRAAELETQLAASREAGDAAMHKQEYAEIELDNAMLELDSVRVSLQSKDKQMLALQKRLDNATDTSAALSRKLQALETDYSAAASLLNKAQLSIAEHQMEQQALEGKMCALQQDNSQLRCQDERTQKTQAALRQLQEKLEDARIETAGQSRLVLAGKERAAELQVEISRLTRHVTSVEEVKKVLKLEVETTNLEISALKSQLEERDSRETASGLQLRALQEVSTTLQSKLQHTQAEAKKLREAIAASEQQVHLLQQSLSAECGKSQGLSHELTAVQESIKAQAHASQAAVAEWKQRCTALQADMQQAQAQLTGGRSVVLQRDALVKQVRALKEDMRALHREMVRAEHKDAQTRQQLHQVDALAKQLQQQRDCDPQVVAQQAENVALKKRLQEAAEAAEARQVQLEEAEHKLDAIDTVKAALERQVQLMQREDELLRARLQAAEGEDSAQRSDLVNQLEVLKSVRTTLEGRLTCASEVISRLEAEVEQGRAALQVERAAHEETQRLLAAERAAGAQAHQAQHELQQELGAMHAGMARQQEDIAALARRNTELVGVRASLARRLSAAEQNLAEAKAHNDALLSSMASERCEREAAQRELEHAQRAGVGHTQHIQMLLRELETANNVTNHQWNLLDAARAHLSEVCAAKDALALEAEQEQLHGIQEITDFVSRLTQVCSNPRQQPQHMAALQAFSAASVASRQHKEGSSGVAGEGAALSAHTAASSPKRERAEMEVRLHRLSLEKEQLMQVAERQGTELLRLRSVLLQAPPTLSPLADQLFA